jgi:hypothetical protein
MASRTATNVLLLMVVVFLMLITVKLYGLPPVTSAEAVDAKPTTSSAMVGCYSQFFNQCEWKQIRVNSEGMLLTTTAR